MLQLQLDKKYRGFVSLLAVLILGMVALSVVSSGLLVSTDNFLQNRMLKLSIQSRHLAETCVEVALNKLKLNVNYTGSETIATSFGSCDILTITGTGNSNRVLQTRATVNNVTREIEVNIQTINPTTVITSWQEKDV